MKNILFVILMLAYTPCLLAQQVTNTINFTADINGILGIGAGGAFDPAQDSLLVMGLDWGGLGQNIVGNRKLVQDPFNPGIFTTTLTVTSGPNSLGQGDSTKWKFRAFPGNRFSNSGWEAGYDRWITYQQDGAVINLPVIIPRIRPIFDALTDDVEIVFYVDMNDPVNRYNGEHIDPSTLEFVGMRGSADWLGNLSGGCWCPDDTSYNPPLMYVLTNVGNNIWSRSVTLPAGTNGGIFEYKYAMMYPGADTINGGSSPLDNEGGFGLTHSLLLNNSSPSLFVINDVFGAFGGIHIPVELTSFSAEINDYQVLLQWQTATETNNQGFEIQRKMIENNIESEWMIIGFKEGYGTSTEPQFYSFNDDVRGLDVSSFIYRLKQVDYDGTYEYSEEVTVKNSTIPEHYFLSQNFPNPFNPGTTIEFTLPKREVVTLTVYDVLGNEVATLIGEVMDAGFHKIKFNADRLSSGVYIYKITAGSFVKTKKMIMLR